MFYVLCAMFYVLCAMFYIVAVGCHLALNKHIFVSCFVRDDVNNTFFVT